MKVVCKIILERCYVNALSILCMIFCISYFMDCFEALPLAMTKGVDCFVVTLLAMTKGADCFEAFFRNDEEKVGTQ